MTVEVVISEQTQVPEVEAKQDPIVEKGDVDDQICNSKAVEKSPSYREESNFLSDLKDNERKALSDLKSKLEESMKKPDSTEENDAQIDITISIWGIPLFPTESADERTNVILLKFLRARDFKVNEAFEMLNKTLKWRKEFNIDSILDEKDLGAELSAVAYMDGVDLENHPICYNMYGVFDDEEIYKNTFGTEESCTKFLRWRFQLMEKGIEKLDLKPGGVSSLLQINDLKNTPAFWKKELRFATRKAVSVLQDNYPEFVARNIFINVPFWYTALNTLLSPFLTQRTKSKFVFARAAKVTETLLKYIAAEQIPVRYGGFKRENDNEFSVEDGGVSEVQIKAGSTETIEIPALEDGTTLLWDITVLGWEVKYKEEFVPNDEGSYTVIVQKNKKIGLQEEPIRNTFKNNEPGKVVITIENGSNKKKKVLYRYKSTKTGCSS